MLVFKKVIALVSILLSFSYEVQGREVLPLAYNDEEFNTAFVELTLKYPLIPQEKFGYLYPSPSEFRAFDNQFRICTAIEPQSSAHNISFCPKMIVPKKLRMDTDGNLIKNRIDKVQKLTSIYCGENVCARWSGIFDGDHNVSAFDIGSVVRFKNDEDKDGQYRLLGFFDFNQTEFEKSVPANRVGLILWNIKKDRFENKIYLANQLEVLKPYYLSQRFRVTRTKWLSENATPHLEKLENAILFRPGKGNYYDLFNSTKLECLNSSGDQIPGATTPDRVEAYYRNNYLHFKFYRDKKVSSHSSFHFYAKKQKDAHALYALRANFKNKRYYIKNLINKSPIAFVTKLPSKGSFSIDIDRWFLNFCELPIDSDSKNSKQIIHFKKKEVVLADDQFKDQKERVQKLVNLEYGLMRDNYTNSFNLKTIQSLVEVSTGSKFSDYLIKKVTSLLLNIDNKRHGIESKAVLSIGNISNLGLNSPDDLTRGEYYKTKRKITILGQGANTPSVVRSLCKLLCRRLNKEIKKGNIIRRDLLIEKIKKAQLFFKYRPDSRQEVSKEKESLDLLMQIHKKTRRPDLSEQRKIAAEKGFDAFDINLFKFIQRRIDGGARKVYLQSLKKLLKGL